MRNLQPRSAVARVLGVLCLLVVLVIGIAPAVHSHPDDSSATRHTCSICATPHAKLNAAVVSAAPVMVAETLSAVEAPASGVSRPASVYFVRPPPAF